MEILSSIVEKIGKSLVLPIGEQFGYLISYKSNIMILEEKFLKLCEKNEAVQQSVGGAEWNQEVVASEVKTWLTNVRERIEEVEKFIEEDVKTNKMCMNGWCPDLKLRYSLGKKAQKNTRAIVELLEEGGKYDRVFNVAPPLKVRSSSTERFKDFESRKAMIRNVLEALRDEKIDMIAICGMGGIGKTEMTKEIARRVKADGLFHEVATTIVSQTPNLTKIQGELAEMLGPRLNAESLQGRAYELYSRLTTSKSVLVILDDVWDPLDLEDVGVYNALKEKGCKILLTSRSEETCNQMRFQKIFPVELLSEDEAWNLFIQMAGDCSNTPNLISIAEQVVRECACLPIAIVTVGSALWNKRDEYEWKAALQELKMSIPQYIPGLHPKVYSSIEFSYNYLKSDEAKSCFLLCCLYPEDYNIPIEHLVRYGVAKRFLNGSSIVEQIRDHVNTIVRNLQRSNLLLDSKWDEYVKMHDIVRDVAISIASRDEHGFMVQFDRGHEEWPQKDTYDIYTTISLLLGEMKGHPNGLKYPKLQFLRLSCLKDSKTLPDNLFNEMNALKMLSLQDGCFSLTSLPPSIQILKNLQMLNLESCRLGDVSAIGTLGKLEILGFRDSEIEEFPHEIGNLSQLKLLDMKGCDSLKRIAAGVLSRLSRLQELYMANFKNWEYTTMMEGNGEGTSNNASLVELIPHFGQMTVLEISVPSIRCLPKEFDFSNSSLRFRINIEDDGSYLFENAIRLNEGEDASDLGKVLLENRSVFGNLKHCDIYNCQHSENIFWLAMVRDLVQLKSLDISKCENIQEIFSNEGDQDKEKVVGGVITLPNLEKINLSSLPRLSGICKSMDSVEVEGGGGSTSSTTLSYKLFSSNTILWLPSLLELHVEKCELLEVVFDLEGLKVIENHQPVVALSQLRILELRYLHGMAHVWKNIPRGFQGFQNLISIVIEKCDNFRSLLPASVAKLLLQLQSLKLRYGELENVIQREDEARDERREDITMSFSSKAHAFEWPSIKMISLAHCPKLKTFYSEIESRMKQKKIDVPEPSVGSSAVRSRDTVGLFNRCLDSCVPGRSTKRSQGNNSCSLKRNKHDINKEVKLTNQDEPNVSETENQTKMCSLFPYYLIESLGNLEVLYARACDSLEVIFELDEGLRDFEESNYIFNNLTRLTLRYLPKLLHIWKKGPRDIKGFNNLRLLRVWTSDSLKYLFTPSIAKLLVKLEEIDVWSCSEMREIIAKESGDEEKRYHVIAFPQVKTLRLHSLPKLECFCNEAIAFIWPSLEDITIVQCEELKMFVPTTSMNTPKLQGVHHTQSETFQPMIEGDLNTTIQHIIKGKFLFSKFQVNLQEISQSSRSP
ncbi:probable disease resistance protein At4g27220 isoform X1 [Carya illinoinensis]|uniref:probable disease resistance protein At4g27220 isoform X1 n=1 Tax=Carya illinoinensis TaxID=32201 RepID=UPI001C719E3E|nr:probable disease resistance protein At4g27220 isoform X1 [Carya illinoinensis]XP_042964904.1 probable disease resistance protein At4g27220 isoform X1 [Carya illinoinensis]XP_042964905.1 probable disease resistance protein At4g27220 isoform X1 [Carya illinoinensis]XP_042964906.1 probable disease resistance protein At4g27220 isoform X1 [Carya illinoinensis]